MDGTLKTKVDIYRKINRMSQEDLAEKVGVRRETILRLEKGLYNPSLKLAWDIAKVFDMKIEDLFEYSKDSEE